MEWKKAVMKKETILVASIFVFILIILGVVTGFLFLMNMGILLVFVFSITYFLARYMQFRVITKYEEEFPNFLRDLSQSIYAGLSLMEAIKATSKSDYGALNKEIRKINNQLSWNVPLQTVLDGFSKRVEESDKIKRSVAILKQSHKSGGNMEDILNSLADNMEKIKDLEEEKKTMMSQHVTMMYAIFFIFVGISISLVKFLIPMLEDTGQESGLGLGLGGSSSPCDVCVDESKGGICNLCNVFFYVSESFGMEESPGGSSYYKGLFFLMIIIEGIFSGLVAGEIKSNSLIGGVRHSIIMGTSGFLIFLLSNWLGII